MGYFLAAYQPVGAGGGTQIPRTLGPSGFQDVGSGHSTSRPSRSGAGIVHHPLISLPNGQVYDPLGSATAVRADMDVTSQGFLVAAPGVLNVSSLLDTWLGFLGTSGVLTRTRDSDSTNQSATARLVIVDANRGYVHRRFLPINLTWTVTGLPWAGAQTATVTGGLAAGANTVTRTNGGDVTQSTMTIVVTAGTNSLTSVTLLNTTTGDTWTYSATVAANKRLVIDTGALSVTNDGANDYAHFTPNTVSDQWFTLAPGSNTMTLTLSGAGGFTPPTIQFQYYDAWA